MFKMTTQIFKLDKIRVPEILKISRNSTYSVELQKSKHVSGKFPTIRRTTNLVRLNGTYSPSSSLTTKLVVNNKAIGIISNGKGFTSSSTKSPAIEQKTQSKGNRIGTSNKPVVLSLGQIGNANVSIFVPFFISKLPQFEEAYLYEAISQTVNTHDSLIKNHGVKDGTKRWKELTGFAMNLLEGKNVNNPGWISTSKVNKWPKKLAHLRPMFLYVKDNYKKLDQQRYVADTMRLILTLFKLNKVKKDFSELNVENIKSTYKLSSDTYNGFEKFVISKFKEIPKDFLLDFDLTAAPFMGSANGPNAMYKIDSADAEAYEIVCNGNELQKPLSNLINLTNNFGFDNYLKSRAQAFSESLKESPELQSKFRNIKLRKLTAIADKGNKSRVIAICDYWTQSMLTPIEKYVLIVTKRLYSKNIAFFSHSKGWSKLLQLEHKERFVSLDATEWTDNLPSGLQYIVLKHLMGQDIAQAWKGLAVDCPWHLGKTDRTIKYGKGQGMGTKGSFAIAQLTNLLFIEWKLKEHYPKSDPYFLEVGDDMVIEDPNFVMKSEFETIGVPINVGKSKIATKYGSYIEFVSRNSWNEFDYSMLSPNLMLKFVQNNFYSLTLLNHLRERGFEADLLNLLNLKTSFFEKSGRFEKAKKLKEFTPVVCKIASLLQYSGEATNLVDSPQKFLDQLSSKELKSVILLLTLLPIYNLHEHYSKQSDTRDKRITIERMNNLKTSYALSGLSIWAFAEKENLDLATIKAMLVVSEIKSRMDARMESGYLAYTLGYKFPPLLVKRYSDDPETATINPAYIQALISLNVAVNDVILDTKLNSRVSLQDKANTKALLELMSSLNRLFQTTTIHTVDEETNSVILDYQKGKTSVSIVSSQLTQYLDYLGLGLDIRSLMATTVTPGITFNCEVTALAECPQLKYQTLTHVSLKNGQPDT